MKTIVPVLAGALAFFVSTASKPLSAQQTQPTDSTPAQTAPAGQDNHLPAVELPENPGKANSDSAAPPVQQTVQQPQPEGTAVAPPIEVSGGAASKPAGVAIAPPKQRRIRSLLIKMGVIAGAGVAIGTVVGLSAASPSHVPNSPGH